MWYINNKKWIYKVNYCKIFRYISIKSYIANIKKGGAYMKDSTYPQMKIIENENYNFKWC